MASGQGSQTGFARGWPRQGEGAFAEWKLGLDGFGGLVAGGRKRGGDHVERAAASASALRLLHAMCEARLTKTLPSRAEPGYLPK